VRNVHEKSRRGTNEPYSCKYCNLTFMKAQKLSDHMIEAHHEVSTKGEIIEEEIYEYEEEEKLE
jgi:hypothetical protein